MTNAEFIDLLKRHPLRVGTCVVAVLSGVGAYLLDGYIEEATRTLSQKASEGDRLAANVKSSGQLAEQYDALAAAGKAIQDRVIHASQLANNLQYFYRLETESGVELLDLRQTSTGTVAHKGPANGVSFSVAVKGDYPTLLGWLRRLENGPHYCRMISVIIASGSPDRSGPMTLNVALELFGQP